MEQMDTGVVETVAGVVRLLRRAAELAWIEADEGGPRSSRQLLALGIDSAADEASCLLPRRPAGCAYTGGAGPSRASCVGGTVVAPDLCCGSTASPVGPEGAGCRADLGGGYRCRRVTDARSASYWPIVTRSRAKCFRRVGEPGPGHGEDLGPGRPVRGSTLGGASSDFGRCAIRAGSDGASPRDRGWHLRAAPRLMAGPVWSLWMNVCLRLLATTRGQPTWSSVMARMRSQPALRHERTLLLPGPGSCTRSMWLLTVQLSRSGSTRTTSAIGCIWTLKGAGPSGCGPLFAR